MELKWVTRREAQLFYNQIIVFQLIVREWKTQFPQYAQELVRPLSKHLDEEDGVEAGYASLLTKVEMRMSGADLLATEERAQQEDQLARCKLQIELGAGD
jgi:hypothetical protein